MLLTPSILVLSLFPCVHPALPFLRWCVIGSETEDLCWKMSFRLQHDKLLNVACVRGASVFQCMRFIRDNIADTVNLNAEQIYVAGKQFHLKILLYEKLSQFNGRFTDDAVVVVRKDQDFKKGLWDLKSKGLCLSGTAPDNLQYQALLNVLFPLGYMKVWSGQCESAIPSLAAHFGPSCVPGTWSLNDNLRRSYATLCHSCNSVCTGQDYFAGSDGAIRCLQQDGGHVGITSTQSIIQSSLDETKFHRLCIQGVRRPLNDTCSWLGRRPNALLISDKIPANTTSKWRQAITAVFLKYMSEGSELVPWFQRILFSQNRISNLIDPYGKDTYDTYLGQVFKRSMETPYPKLDCGIPRTLIWCVVLRKHIQKCKEMAGAFVSVRLKPSISCIQSRTTTQCTQWLAENKAHVTIVPPVEAVTAERDFGLVPVAVEQTALSDPPNPPRYLVAVAKRSSNVTIEHLFASKSCQTGISDILGYQAPAILLAQRKRLDLNHCNFPLAISNLFWQSCIPGLQKSLLSDYGLCQVCKNQDCAATPQGPRSALECLNRPKNGGDISFLTTDSLKLVDKKRFQLLCLDGRRGLLSDYQKCHWLKLPSKVLMMSADHFNSDERKKVTQLLIDAARLFGSENSQNGHFSLFSTENDPNSLFETTTGSLTPIWPNSRTENLVDALGEDFVKIYRTFLDCNRSEQAQMALFHLIVCLLLVLACQKEKKDSLT